MVPCISFIFLSNSVTLREKRVPKRCPWGTIASNSTLFSNGHSFFLNNHVCGKRVPLPDRGTFLRNSTPRGTICPIRTLFRKSGTMLVPFLPVGYCFEAKKGRKQYPFFRGVLFRSKKGRNQYPSEEGYHFFSLIIMFIKQYP